MAIGIVGTKQGMTRVFTEDGRSVPVTVVEATPNRVTQVKQVEQDGYSAVQVTFGAVKASRVNRPAAGHFKKAQVEAGRKLIEFTLTDDDAEVGSELSVDAFEVGQKVDVTGQSKGKGFQGVIKRHNFSMQDATHGNSLSHRAPGSIGQCQTPGRVWKGKKMAGHMGDHRVTTQNLKIYSTDVYAGIILIEGAVPGSKGSYVLVKDAHKSPRPEDAPFPASIRSKVEGNNKEPSAESSGEEIEEVSATNEVPNQTDLTKDVSGIDEASTEEKES